MVKEAHRGKTLPQIADLYGVGRYDTHFFLCAGPDCCTPEVGDSAWQQVKAKIKALFPNLSASTIYRTKASCFRMCQDGPIAVCYPQGKWFRNVTADRVDSVIDHIVSRNPEPHPLEFAANPLPRQVEAPRQERVPARAVSSPR
jgi:(2Fe-2S) ferredoxin